MSHNPSWSFYVLYELTTRETKKKSPRFKLQQICTTIFYTNKNFIISISKSSSSSENFLLFLQIKPPPNNTIHSFTDLTIENRKLFELYVYVYKQTTSIYQVFSSNTKKLYGFKKFQIQRLIEILINDYTRKIRMHH